MNKLKADKRVLPRYQSCYTAISQDGYIFEGYTRADVIQRFLVNPPSDAIGLAIPGMEIGNRYDEYDVLFISNNDSRTVYEHVDGK